MKDHCYCYYLPRCVTFATWKHRTCRRIDPLLTDSSSPQKASTLTKVKHITELSFSSSQRMGMIGPEPSTLYPKQHRTQIGYGMFIPLSGHKFEQILAEWIR